MAFKKFSTLRARSTVLFFFLLATHKTNADLTFCAGKGNGDYAHPRECNKFYTCSAGVSYERACPKNLVFNPNPLILRCDYPRHVNCQEKGSSSDNLGFCHGKPNGRYPHTMNCNQFFNCHDGNGVAMSCPSGMLYNRVRRYCDRPNNVVCVVLGGPNANTQNFCSGRDDGLYANPSDCSKFFQCHQSGLTTEQSCLPGLLFDSNAKTCNWPQNVKCSSTSDASTAASAADSTSPRKPAESEQSACQRRVCYHTNWSQYRPGAGKFLPTDINPFLCTHIIYSFANLRNNELLAFEWNDDSTDWSVGMYKQVLNLKQQNSDLKILLAVGGWKMASKPFTAMVATARSRAHFITTSIHFLRQRNFDGLDLDWEYPAARGSPPEDRGRFTALVKELRAAFDAEGLRTNRPPLLLTAAVAAGKDKIDGGYDIPAISAWFDFINLMAYDLHGGWEDFTGHNSPLYAGDHERNKQRKLNVDWAAKYWIRKGCPPNKLVIGLPLYGRSFTLTTSKSSIGAPATPGRPGPYTREKGYASYYEVCGMLQQAGVQTSFLKDQRVPYLVLGNQWVGYDNPRSLREKVRYIKSNNYGGAMVWAMDLDDFSGSVCNAGPYPLLTAIVNECNSLS